MKILYTTNIFPNIDGTSIFLQGLSETLNKSGHKSIVLSSSIPTNLKIKSTKNYKIIKIPNQAFDFFFKRFLKERSNRLLNLIKNLINNIESKFVFYSRKLANKCSLSLLWGLLYDVFGWKLLLKLLKLNTNDVDIFFTTPIPRSCIIATLIAARLKKIPVVITPAYHFMLNNYTFFDKRWVKILKKFDRVITYTNAELNYLCKIGVPRKILKTIGVGIPFYKIYSAGDGNWREKLKIPKDKFVILYLNSFIREYYKGIDAVIKASIQLFSIYFIFVGRFKEDWDFLRNKYNLGELKNVIYREYISNDEKYQLYNAVDLIVRPSLNESFGLVFFEGMSAGKPIITSNIEAMTEISKDVGLTIPFDNENELIDAILHLKNNKELYQKLSKNSLIKSENYSWQNIAKKYEKSFKSLIRKKKRHFY